VLYSVRVVQVVCTLSCLGVNL